ncbi:acyl-CoA dehydrogenase family protein [Myxococcus sp. MISCRS1]|uniref:acyl-CoA dehydrogenase family protein n=1 Tax=Myxococcus sp. MISCRS1 TaxID=2996786 RepID=UPI002D1E3478|nr:acyl-CoA dehydrogenase family protein [Myxococcus sp. MISCRS1]
MSAGINTYKTDLREIFFTLFEQFGFGQVAGQAPYDAWGPDEAKAVLSETYRFAREVLGPLNSVGDREGCRVENGSVYTPTGFKDAWKKLYEQGFKTVAVSPEHGGQGAPMMLQVTVEELLSGANTAFNMYPGLSFGGRGHRGVRHEGAAAPVRGAHAQRHVGRHHVPHRAARRLRRGRGQVHRAPQR